MASSPGAGARDGGDASPASVPAATAGSAAAPSAAGAAAASAGHGGELGGMSAGGVSGSSGSASGAVGGTGGAALPPCTMPTSYAQGSSMKTLQQQGRTRQYTVYAPRSLAGTARVPLVLDFHGSTSSGAQEQAGSGWQQKADAEGFIVVFPDGVGSAWNVGNCCGQALSEMVDDVGFAKAIVSEVSKAACIDPKRVYATGISNGGGLAHRLACEAADVFAAIAAASADLVTDPCTPARPITELSVRGESDTLVAYEGGNTGSTGWYSPGAKGTLDLWKKIDGCTGTVAQTLEYCETYSACAAGVEITLCSLPGTGHILYQNSLGFDVPNTAWQMFMRQPMP